MIRLDARAAPAGLRQPLERFFSLAEHKIRRLAERWDPAQGAPVLTVEGRYTTRTWADWTQGFQFGSALLVFEATGERWFLDWGRRGTLRWMPQHLTHTGGHDHGFNVVSSYGNLLRLAVQGRSGAEEAEREPYRLALRVSGAVQAARWTARAGGGFIHSFHGPHSLFVDTLRSLRSLALAHALGQELRGEGDARISLLQRLIEHALTTARYSVFYGEGRDHYDVRGRVAHECFFNVTDGSFRCTGTQQGFSPFSTWTRGLAWAMLGFAEQLEFLRSRPAGEFGAGGQEAVEQVLRRAAEATCDYYLDQAAADGIPYWDTAAPGLTALEGYRERPSDPYNGLEPVDSSAAAIAAQGLWRLGGYLDGAPGAGQRSRSYRQAALAIAAALFAPPYLSEEEAHEGLILHGIYNRPGGWDYIPPGHGIPCGEAVMWGDYHALELAVLLWREANGQAYPTFFEAVGSPASGPADGR